MEAEEKINIITRILHEKLVKEGRQGACVDMAMVLRRMLDREGIWIYPQSGSLTITFPDELKLPPRYFRTVGDGQFVAGHVWLSAPPFNIINLALSEKLYRHNEKDYLPGYILQKKLSTNS